MKCCLIKSRVPRVGLAWPSLIKPSTLVMIICACTYRHYWSISSCSLSAYSLPTCTDGRMQKMYLHAYTYFPSCKPWKLCTGKPILTFEQTVRRALLDILCMNINRQSFSRNVRNVPVTLSKPGRILTICFYICYTDQEFSFWKTFFSGELIVSKYPLTKILKLSTYNTIFIQH